MSRRHWAGVLTSFQAADRAQTGGRRGRRSLKGRDALALALQRSVCVAAGRTPCRQEQVIRKCTRDAHAHTLMKPGNGPVGTHTEVIWSGTTAAQTLFATHYPPTGEGNIKRTLSVGVHGGRGSRGWCRGESSCSALTHGETVRCGAP